MINRSSKSGKGPHRDRSKEMFWRRALAEHAASGQDIRAFCRERGLTEPSFYAWRRALAGRDREPIAARVAERPGFVELTSTHSVPARPPRSASNGHDAPLEIVAGNHRLLIRPGCDLAWLREVLAALGE